MELIIDAVDLNEQLSCIGNSSDSFKECDHDDCGEQCEHQRCLLLKKCP